jgi:predicted phage terminase large subunit-like protein
MGAHSSTGLTDEQMAINEASRNSFDFFAQRAFASVEGGVAQYEWNWHIGCIADHLEAVRRGEIKKLIINVPPRTLKTYLTTTAFPAWVMGLEPHSKFIGTSYGGGLVEDAIVNCKNIMKDDWYRQCFPGSTVDPKQDTKSYFKTTSRGQYYGAGILGTITGKGADYVICDDPLKPGEALSDTIRVETNKAIRNTLFSRFNDSRVGRFILIMQRLHEDDPTGHLLKDGGYHLLKLPAEASDRPTIVTLGEKSWVMKKGDLLFPARLTRDVLDEKRKDLLDYNYVGQFLQDPVPLGGGEFKDSWLQYYDKSGIKAPEMNVLILCDPAGGEETQKKKKKNSDYTTLMVVGLAPDNNYYLLDAVRDRLNPTERVNKLFELHRTWNGLTGKPPKVGYEKYGIMTDTHYIRQVQKETGYRFTLVELGGKMSKEERIRRMIPDLQNGRWWFPDAIMYTDYEGRTMDLVHELKRSEMETFPRSRYDDMLDAITRIYDTELQAVFPRINKRSINSGFNAGKRSGYDSFMDF